MKRAFARVNPVTRIGMAVLLSIPVIISLDWVSAGTVLALELIFAVITGTNLAALAKRLIPVFIVAPVAALNMALYGQTAGQIYMHWGFITISQQSLMLALAVILRVFAFAVAAIILLGGVDATDMADGLAQVVKLPARFVLGTLAGVRMTGLFADDWRALAQARRARGLGDQGRIRRWATMALTLLVLAIRRGTRLATAMEARGFGGNDRTWARSSTVGWRDAIALLVCVLIGLAAFTAAWFAGTLWIVGS